MRWFASLVLLLFRFLRFWPVGSQRLRWQLHCLDLAIDVYHYDGLDEHVTALMPAYLDFHAQVHGDAPGDDAGAALTNRLVIFGRILIQAGHHDRGEDLLARAVAFFGGPGPAPPTRVWASGLFDLGGVFLELHRMEEALPWLEKALELRTAVHGADSFEVAQCHNNLGYCLNRLSRFDEAEGSILEAIRLHTRHSGAKSSEVAGAYCNLAENRLRRGQAAEALPILQDALEGTLGSDAIRSDLLDSLADVYAALGRLQECRMAAERSIDTALRDGKVAKVIEYARKLTDRLESAGRPEEAGEYRDMAQDLQRRHYFHKARQEGVA
ncbi:MAG: tetratricopeptide repeat protein [Bryobacterales bacterium]|nr:tetratricopeptide repeat protein [Bryobacterales bacterium]